MPQFHHLSICNQNHSISNLLIYNQTTKSIALRFGQKCLLVITFNVNQNQSISNLVICHQNTKAIALRFGQKCIIFITFQSAITINEFQISSFVTKVQRLLLYVLTKHASFSSLFNLQSKSINVKFGHCSPKYQGSSLTSWPICSHFHHFSICNQNQSISHFVICHQYSNAIALLFGEKCLIFITFQSVIKINQFHISSFVTNTPML